MSGLAQIYFEVTAPFYRQRRRLPRDESEDQQRRVVYGCWLDLARKKVVEPELHCGSVSCLPVVAF
jgi:hypothetical protein